MSGQPSKAAATKAQLADVDDFLDMAEGRFDAVAEHLRIVDLRELCRRAEGPPDPARSQYRDCGWWPR